MTGRTLLGRTRPIRLRQALHPRVFCRKSRLQEMKTFIVIEYADKFSDTTAPLPATLTPLEIMVDKAKWEKPQTRGPVGYKCRDRRDSE
jgi:hypothetical protein